MQSNWKIYKMRKGTVLIFVFASALLVSSAILFYFDLVGLASLMIVISYGLMMLGYLIVRKEDMEWFEKWNGKK